MQGPLDFDQIDNEEARVCYQRALACQTLAQQASAETDTYPKNLEKILESAKHYEEALGFIRRLIKLLPKHLVTPGLFFWLYDTESVYYHSLGDHAYYSGDYEGKVLYHDRAAESRAQLIEHIPEGESFDALRLLNLGQMYYVQADALDGRAVLLEQEEKWREAAEIRKTERDLKRKELDCLKMVLPPSRLRHHVSRVWSAERTHLMCLVRLAQSEGDFPKAMEYLRDAAYAAERARQASPDWTPYGQVSRQLQSELRRLIEARPELIEGESVDALIIKYLGKGAEAEYESLGEIIVSLEQVAARKRKHLIPRCYKIGTPFCPYRLEEMEGQVFVGMPFRPEYENAFKYGIAPAIEDVGLTPWKANDIISNIDIMCKMCYAIQQSPYGVVNVSDWNPNVMFELGLLYAMRKHALLVKDSRQDVPVDLAGIEYVEYSRFDHLRASVRAHFAEVLKQGDGIPRECFKLGVPSCPLDVKEDPRRVFVGMPFREEQQNAYLYGVKPAVERVGLRTWKADEDLQNIDIMCKICQWVQRSLYGVIDITGWNPNVMFELGLLYGHGKKVVLIKHQREDVPADLRGLEFIEYDDFSILGQRLQSFLQSFF